MELFPTALRSWKLSIAASLAAMSLSGLAIAQVKTAPPARPAAPGAPVAAATVSPEAALEDKLMGSLAAREMDSLLEYYFKKHNIPPLRGVSCRTRR
jgi:hypothetical protein